MSSKSVAQLPVPAYRVWYRQSYEFVSAILYHGNGLKKNGLPLWIGSVACYVTIAVYFAQEQSYRRHDPLKSNTARALEGHSNHQVTSITVYLHCLNSSIDQKKSDLAGIELPNISVF